MVDDAEFWILLKWKFVNFLTFYEFDGDTCLLSEVLLLVRLNGDPKWVAKVMKN